MFQARARGLPIRMRVLAFAGTALAIAGPLVGQEGPGDQIFGFGIGQTFGVNDNLRLDPDSAGTTSYSDTNLSFGFSNRTAVDALDFQLGGVFRLVDDPILGTESGFRDQTFGLNYLREGADARLAVFADYANRDLAFVNPVDKIEISDQDIFQGGGTLEEYAAGLRLETGLQAPLGFVLDARSSGRSYSDTTDPLLFPNRTNYVSLASVIRFSPVTQGQLAVSDNAYSSEDTLETQRDTRMIDFGLTHQFDEITALNLTLGHSEVTETFDLLPGVESVTSGPVGEVSLLRQMPNGSASATLGTTLSEDGRQSTLEFGRLLALPAGGLEFTFGVTQGSGFDLQPVGSLVYSADLPTGALTAAVESYVDVSPTLSQTTRTTRVIFGYDYQVNEVSSLSFDLFYADLSYARDVTGDPARSRGSFSATYARDVTEDWDFLVGYEYGYYESTADGPARSNQLTFTLQRDFDVFR